MTPATKAFTGILAAAALAAPALAQTQSFDGRAAFRSDHNHNTTPNVGDVLVHPFVSFGGTLNLSLLLGGFDAQGFENHGMFAWRGDITVEGTGVSIGNSPGARGPFNFSPIGSGATSPDGLTLSDIDVVRNPLFWLPWPEGDPSPVPQPFPQGNDAYYPAFRFTLELTDLSVREITVTATGTMQVISEMVTLGGVEGEEVQILPVRYVTDTSVSRSFTIIVPAPAAAPLLGLAGLLAARRRRS